MGCATSSLNRADVSNPLEKNALLDKKNLSRHILSSELGKNKISDNSRISPGTTANTAKTKLDANGQVVEGAGSNHFLSERGSPIYSDNLPAIHETVFDKLAESFDPVPGRKYAEHSIKVDFSKKPKKSKKIKKSIRKIPKIQKIDNFHKVLYREKEQNAPEKIKKTKAEFIIKTKPKSHLPMPSVPSREHTATESFYQESSYGSSIKVPSFSDGTAFDLIRPIYMKSDRCLPSPKIVITRLCQKKVVKPVLEKSTSNIDCPSWSFQRKLKAQISSPEIMKRIQAQKIRRFAVFKVESGQAHGLSLTKQGTLELEKIQYSKDHQKIIADKKISKTFQIKTNLKELISEQESNEVRFDTPKSNMISG
jgi:hypothetical protein